MEEVPCRTSLAPFAFPCFILCLIGLETEGLLDYQGRAGDHVHCTVEPSPGHIWCRKTKSETKSAKNTPKRPRKTLSLVQLKLWSPKAGHNKAGRSDSRNQRFKPDTGKMRKVPLTPEKQGSEEIPQSNNAENAEDADTKRGKCG